MAMTSAQVATASSLPADIEVSACFAWRIRSDTAQFGG